MACSLTLLRSVTAASFVLVWTSAVASARALLQLLVSDDRFPCALDVLAPHRENPGRTVARTPRHVRGNQLWPSLTRARHGAARICGVIAASPRWGTFRC